MAACVALAAMNTEEKVIGMKERVGCRHGIREGLVEVENYEVEVVGARRDDRPS